MESFDTQAAPTAPTTLDKGKKSLWSRLRTFFVITSFLGLGSLNVLTLLNDGIHAMAYNAMKAVLSSTLPEVALSKVLSKSTSFRRQADVRVATKLLQEEKVLLASANRNLELKHVALEKTQREIEAKHSELMRVSQLKAVSAKRVSKRVVSRIVLNSSRKVPSVFAESIPWAGAAIVVGMTAWDIADACETIKDLNELNAAFGEEKEDETKVCGIKVPTKDEALAQVKGNWQVTYQAAAESLNKAGAATMSVTPPKISWPDIKGTICSILGSVPMICP